MAPDPDAQSRLNVDLMTSKTQSYDEVVAFSERILNKNFSTLFDLYKEMKVIKRFITGQPSLDAVLNPSRIIIPNDTSKYGANTVFYQIRFESGTVKDAFGLKEVEIGGWELAIPAQLGYVEISKDSKQMVDRADMKEITVDSRRYAYPGDYSVSRLYAQLATAKWGDPDVFYSFVVDPDTGKRMRLDEWKRDNSDLFDAIKSGLTGWVEDHDAKGLSTLNVKFTLPATLANPQKPSYTPTYVRQQAYQHIGREFDHTLRPEELEREAAKAPPVTSGQGYNCLLWCEMVDGNARPSIPDLSWSGNYVVEPQDIAGQNDMGTFALSYQHFFERHLLPRLKVFNQGVDISNLSYKPYWDAEKREAGVKWNYSVGYDPEHSQSSDKVFDFDRKVDPSNKQNPVTYVFSKTNSDKTADNKDENGIHHWTECDSWHWHVHKSAASVAVSWPITKETGADTINVSGHTEYSYESKWSNNKELTDTTTHLYFKYYVNWNFNIVLSEIKNGTIKFRIDQQQGPDGPASLAVTNDPFITENPGVPKDTGDSVKKYIAKNLSSCLKTLEDELKQALSSNAKFTYPGNGSLDFSNPVVNRLGNVLANISYKPMVKQEGYVQVSQIEEIKLPTVPVIKPKTSTVTVGVIQPGPKLTWAANPPQIPAETKDCKFQWVGTNNTDGDLYFNTISIKFTSSTIGPNMLAADCINGSWIADMKPKDPPSHKSGIISGAISTIKSALSGSGAPETPAAPAAPATQKTSPDPTKLQESAVPKKQTTDDGGWDELDDSSAETGAETGAEAGTKTPPPPPPPPHNVITVKASSSKTIVNPKLIVMAAGRTGEGIVYWIANICAPASGWFVVPKGESISYDFVIDTSLARKSPIFVTEHWRDTTDPTKEVDGRSENTRWSQDVTLVRV